MTGPGADIAEHSGRTAPAQYSKRHFWTKRRRVLLYLVSGKSLNRFEAVSRLHDWVLPTTIAQIQEADGIRVWRRQETIRGFMGNPTTVARYWLIEPEREKAIQRLCADAVSAAMAYSEAEARRFLVTDEAA